MARNIIVFIRYIYIVISLIIDEYIYYWGDRVGGMIPLNPLTLAHFDLCYDVFLLFCVDPGPKHLMMDN